jgi:hypothetical protein
MDKKFKVGDSVAILAKVVKIIENNDYPIRMQIGGTVSGYSCTKNGEVTIGNYKPNVVHLEDLQPKSEFPKWMIVSGYSPYEPASFKRYVIGNVGNVYIAINYAEDENHEYYKEYHRDSKNGNYTISTWKYAKDIEKEIKNVEEKINRDEVREKIAEIWKSLTAIIKEIEKS